MILDKNIRLLKMILKAGHNSGEIDYKYPQSNEMYWMSQQEHLSNFILARLHKATLIVKNKHINGSMLRQKGAIEWVKENINFNEMNSSSADAKIILDKQESFDLLIFLIHYLSIQQNIILDKNNSKINLVADMLNNLKEMIDDKTVSLDEKRYKELESFVNIYKRYFWEHSNLYNAKIIIDFFNDVFPKCKINEKQQINIQLHMR